MKRAYHFILISLSYVSGGTAIIYGLLGYFLVKVRPDGTIYDFLNRELTEAPVWAKVFVINDNLWSGFGWIMLDRVIFLGLFGVAIGLFKLSSRFEENNKIMDVKIHERFKK